MEVLIPAGVLGAVLAVLEIDFHHQRRALGIKRRLWPRRCPETIAGAGWLVREAGQLDCPRCGRLLANHRR